MKSLGSIGSFLWALVLVVLAFICTGHSFKQELTFYDAQENRLHFDSQVSDTSEFSLFLPNVTRVCTRGMWFLFSTANFTVYHSWQGSYSDTGIVCKNFTEAASVESLRHVGANDTDTDAFSLYDGWLIYSGKEIFVTAQAYTGITSTINYISATGTSNWMLFEGMNLDGKSVCYEVPYPGWYYNSDYVSSLKLETIGSVFKGCDVKEIQNYKMLHTSSVGNSS